MAIGTDQGRESGTQIAELTCTGHRDIDPIAAEWDQLVPRDFPHLRAGFLRACQQSGMVQDPLYLMLHYDGQPAAVAVAYTLTLDAALAAPPERRRWIDRVRRFFPGFKQRSLRICGSPVENAENGVYFVPRLPQTARREIIRRVAQEVLRTSHHKQTIYFKDFTEEAAADYASELETLGFFPVDPGPAMKLPLRWPSFEHYLSAMHKRYRAAIRRDLKASQELDFCLHDTFADLAPVVMPLYRNVLAHAKSTLQQVNEGFLAALSEFEQAKLLVARHRASGEVVGFNLLLFGDTCMHNMYIGYEDALNEQCHTYFSLAENSLRLAMEKHCPLCYLGQASYEFKTRLGATPVTMVAYMKHRVWPVHRMLLAARDKIFPVIEVATHDVFHADGESD
jgi:predicted N-acyltransferase